MPPQVNEQDLVVAPGQFALVLDSTKGNVDVLVGPHKTSLSGTDVPVKWNRDKRTFEATNNNDARQQFPTASEGYYIVVENPAVKDPDHPVKGSRSSSVELHIGRRVNIPGPCSFPLYPAQSVEVIQGHHLRSNQYLLVRVYNEEQAKANWGKAVIKGAEGAENGPTKLPVPTKLSMGQLLVIKGTDVSFYIPPTGVEVIKDENGLYTRNAETLEQLEFCILLNENGTKRYVTGPDVVFPEPTETFINQSGVRKGRAIELNQISGLYIKVIAPYEENGKKYQAGDELFITGKEQSIYFPRQEHSLIKYGERVINYAVALPAGEGRYVLDRNTGNVRIEKGPSMFLPDPRKEVIVRRILSDAECQLLYPGNAEALFFNQELAESELVNPDEIQGYSLSTRNILRSAPTVTAGASISSSVVTNKNTAMKPLTRHLESTPSVMYTAASPQSAAEMMIATPDITQRKEAHTPPRTITLNTKYDGVVAVDVWSGYAALFVRKNGDRRVVVGPQTVFLEYDEHVMPLELSTGTPKVNTTKLRTAFLRVLNNSVSDLIKVETKDSFTADIPVRYHLNFVGTDPTKWFEVENYVQFLAERMRSIIRREAKIRPVREIKDGIIDIIRNLILGPKDATKGRTGRLFEENSMQIFDLDVVTPKIQGDIDAQLQKVEQEALQQQLTLAAKQRELAHITQIQEIDRQIATQKAETTKHNQAITKETLVVALETDLQAVQNAVEVAAARLDAEAASQDTLDEIAERKLTREKASQHAEVEDLRSRTMIEVTELKEKLGAFSPQLAEAVRLLSNEQIMAAFSQAVSPYAILGGTSISDVLQKVLTGTGVGEQLQKMLATKAGQSR